MILLTQEERDKFSAWLEQEARSDDGMSGQLEKLKGHEIMTKRLKQRAATFFLVATELRKIEDFKI